MGILSDRKFSWLHHLMVGVVWAQGIELDHHPKDISKDISFFMGPACPLGPWRVSPPTPQSGPKWILLLIMEVLFPLEEKICVTDVEGLCPLHWQHNGSYP